MSQSSIAEDAPAAMPPPPAAKSGKGLMIVMALVILAGAGGAAWWFLVGQKGQASDAEVAKPAVKPQYASLGAAFVVNLGEDHLNRYLQIDAQAMAHSEAALEALGRHEPLIRNQLLLLFSSQRAEQLSTRAGKENLQVAALEEIRSVLQSVGEDVAIEAVYFTSFVMQ